MEPAAGKYVRYQLDARASQFTVQAFANGLVAAVAHSPKIAIRDWQGEAQFVPGTLEGASLRVRIKAASLQVLDEMRDNDRNKLQRVMNDEVLETARFPEVRFDSSGISAEKQNENLFRVKVNGNLALHGVSGNLALNAQLAMGVDSFRAYGDFLVMQSDYHIPIAAIAGGTLRLRDELKFSFYVVGRKQEAAADK
jgi:polyisoprenoid-binding protein YceI